MPGSTNLVKLPVLEYFLGRGAHFLSNSICFSVAVACPHTGSDTHSPQALTL